MINPLRELKGAISKTPLFTTSKVEAGEKGIVHVLLLQGQEVIFFK